MNFCCICQHTINRYKLTILCVNNCISVFCLFVWLPKWDIRLAIVLWLARSLVDLVVSRSFHIDADCENFLGLLGQHIPNWVPGKVKLLKDVQHDTDDITCWVLIDLHKFRTSATMYQHPWTWTLIKTLYLMPRHCIWCYDIEFNAKTLYLIPRHCIWCQDVEFNPKTYLIPRHIWCQDIFDAKTLYLMPWHWIWCQDIVFGDKTYLMPTCKPELAK